MPSRAHCILFGKLPHARSAAIQGPTCMCMRAPTSAGKSASTHVCRDGREMSTNHEAHPPTRTGAMHHGARLLMAVSCNWRASVGPHARYVHLDGERGRRVHAWPVHGSIPGRPSRHPVSPMRKGGNDIIPWWMLHPSGIAEYLARDTTTSKRHRRAPRPTPQRRDSMRPGVHAARRRLSPRIHPSLEGTTTSIDDPTKKLVLENQAS